MYHVISDASQTKGSTSLQDIYEMIFDQKDTKDSRVCFEGLDFSEFHWSLGILAVDVFFRYLFTIVSYLIGVFVFATIVGK
jgi:hypothetical protein